MACTFPECPRPSKALGYCSGHYQQVRKGITPRPLRDRVPRTDHTSPTPPSADSYSHHGCRCDACTFEHARQHKAWRLRRSRVGAATIDSAGTLRRLRALCRAGWSRQQVATMLGVAKGNLQALISGRETVTKATAARVRRAYDRHWQGPPEPASIDAKSKRTRATRAAERNGWPPPLAWDEGDGPHGIDNPAATPHRMRPAASLVSLDEIEWLADAGETAERICERIGTERNSLYSRLRRSGRDDLWRKITRMEAA